MFPPLKLALLGGAIYLAVWLTYRRLRHIEHRKYLAIHAEEHLARARYEAERKREDMKIGRPTDPEEILRRAEWNSKYGPLLSALEIKNREEMRWPVGGAFQGLATLMMGLVVASLITNARMPLAPYVAPQGTAQENQAPSAPAVQAAGESPLDSVFLLSLVLVASGAIFWRFSDSRIGRTVGASLVLSASVLAGLKILSIEKLIAGNPATASHLSAAPVRGDPARAGAGD
jgi:hypothetical protein